MTLNVTNNLRRRILPPRQEHVSHVFSLFWGRVHVSKLTASRGGFLSRVHFSTLQDPSDHGFFGHGFTSLSPHLRPILQEHQASQGVLDTQPSDAGHGHVPMSLSCSRSCTPPLQGSVPLTARHKSGHHQAPQDISWEAGTRVLTRVQKKHGFRAFPGKGWPLELRSGDTGGGRGRVWGWH